MNQLEFEKLDVIAVLILFFVCYSIVNAEEDQSPIGLLKKMEIKPKTMAIMRTWAKLSVHQNVLLASKGRRQNLTKKENSCASCGQ